MTSTITEAPPTRPVKSTKPVVIEWRMRRRAWLLRRLGEADGPSYDALCAAAVEQFPVAGPSGRFIGPREGVRSVRDMLSDGLATMENDESVWLTPSGWAALERLRLKDRRRVK